MVLLQVDAVVKGFWQHAYRGQYACILTNSAQEITPHRFEFKSHGNRIRKYFLFIVLSALA
jgi:hypothetical protein